jgi:hypothetical protein
VSVPRIYKEDLRQLREELRESLETVVENDWEEMAMSQLSSETPPSQNMNSGAEELRHQNYWVPFCGVESLASWRYVCCSTVILGVCDVVIRCQETDSGDCNRLRTLASVTENCKVWKWATAL